MIYAALCLSRPMDLFSREAIIEVFPRQGCLPNGESLWLSCFFRLLPGFSWSRLSSQVLTCGLRKKLFYLCRELIL
jgi:hypothetical protein